MQGHKAKITIELPGSLTKTAEGDAIVMLVHNGNGTESLSWAETDLEGVISLLVNLEKTKREIISKSNDPALALFGDEIIERAIKDDKGESDFLRRLLKKRRGGGD